MLMITTVRLSFPHLPTITDLIMLDQFRAYNPNIEYEFVDPNGFENRTERDEFYRRLFERGLSPINIKTTKSNTQNTPFEV